MTMDITDLKRRAGIAEQADPKEEVIGYAISDLMDLFNEIQSENATPQHIQGRLGDVIQILRKGIGDRVDAGY